MGTCLALLYNLRSEKRLFLQKKEERESNWEYSGEGEFESKVNESMEVQPLFETKKSALNCNYVLRNFPRTIATELAGHISVVEMLFIFGAGERHGVLLGHARDVSHGKLATIQLWWTDAMKNSPRVPPEERSFGWSTNGRERRCF